MAVFAPLLALLLASSFAVVCSEGGTTSCAAAIVAARASAKKSTELLNVTEVYCDGKTWCAALGTPVANAFAQRERVALAALPPLSAGSSVSDVSQVFGAVLGQPTTVRALERTVGPAGEPSVNLDRVQSSKIDAAHVSPDGTTAAFAVTAKVGVMCWDFTVLSTIVVDIARKKASLANTIGWKAYQKKDLVTARAGYVASAQTSLAAARAIDPSFQARACRDADFTPLRASLACPAR